MPQSSATDTVLQTLLHERGAGLGASITALARELEARLDPVHRDALLELIQTWPMDPDGTPHDADALYHRLMEMRALPAAAPVNVKAGSPGAATTGLLLGVLAGVPIGFITFVVLAEFVMPREFSSMEMMWVVMLLAMGLGGFIGMRNGGSPSRRRRAAARGVLGFLLGALLSAFAGAVVAGILGSLLNVSQREGAFAMGVVFVIAPVSGLVGGALLGLWMARKAWREWGRSA